MKNWGFVAFFCCLAKVFADATHELSDWDLVSPMPLDAELAYSFGGSTVLSRKQVKLTSDSKDQRGYIVSRPESPLPENFEFTMDFKIDGEGRNLYGDGMALWFLEDSPREGAMMGLNEFYKGVSVVIDTYRNGKAGRIFPRLLLAQNDGTKSYDKDNDGRGNEIDSCGLRGLHNNKRQDFSSLKVSYSRSLRKIVIEANFRNKWELCARADLDMGPVSKIAVSAATGELSEEHVVKDLRLVDLGSIVPSALRGSSNAFNKKKGSSRDDREGWSFFSFVKGVFKLIFKLLAAAGLGVAAFKGYKQFKKYQRKRDDDRYKLN